MSARTWQCSSHLSRVALRSNLGKSTLSWCISTPIIQSNCYLLFYFIPLCNRSPIVFVFMLFLHIYTTIYIISCTDVSVHCQISPTTVTTYILYIWFYSEELSWWWLTICLIWFWQLLLLCFVVVRLPMYKIHSNNGYFKWWWWHWKMNVGHVTSMQCNTQSMIYVVFVFLLRCEINVFTF